MEHKFRLLTADEIECRVGTCKPNGCSLLLYKDARVDMKLLDETFGWDKWTKEYERVGDNLYCTISVYSDELKQWIRKQDVGVPSNTEAQKGEASDAFKRAGFCFGIGRELYTAPFVWIALSPDEVENFNGKARLKASVHFEVTEIEYSADRKITRLVIKDGRGAVRYTMGGSRTAQPAQAVKAVMEQGIDFGHAAKTNNELLAAIAKATGGELDAICKEYATQIKATPALIEAGKRRRKELNDGKDAA